MSFIFDQHFYSYCQEIMDSVTDKMNAVYLEYKRRNPEFEGEISIVAHSLGGVISFELLSNQVSLHFCLQMMF